MKKTSIRIATSLAVSATILLSFSSCGLISFDPTGESDLLSKVPANNSSEKQAKNDTKKTTIDPFENVNYTIPEESIGTIVYPTHFEIFFDASESPLGKVATFTYFIESADEDEIVIKSRANIDTNEVQKYLDENNFKVDENEKTFVIKSYDLKTDLVSEDEITKEVQSKIESDMLEYIESELKTSEDEKLEFSIENLYLTMPIEVGYQFSPQKQESSISHYSDTSSFEDVEIYINEARLGINTNNISSKVIGVLKDNNDSYYCMKYSGLVFNKGVLETTIDNCELLSSSAMWLSYPFESEKAAYDRYFGDGFDSDTYEIVELPLD